MTRQRSEKRIHKGGGESLPREVEFTVSLSKELPLDRDVCKGGTQTPVSEEKTKSPLSVDITPFTKVQSLVSPVSIPEYVSQDERT